MRTWFPLAALLVATPALAEHAVSLGASTLQIRANYGVYPIRMLADAGYAYKTDRWLLGGGVRLATPQGGAPVPLEVYTRALLSARVGPWSPALGPELGYSFLSEVGPRESRLPPDILGLEAKYTGPLYVAVHAAPLRFTFGRFTFSALEVTLGTPITTPATLLRLQVGLLSAGVQL
jgi:hypothetical protein